MISLKVSFTISMGSGKSSIDGVSRTWKFSSTYGMANHHAIPKTL